MDRYFAEMPAMAARRTGGAARRVSQHAFPRYPVTAGTVAEAEAMLADPELDAALRRVVVDATDELRRGLAARALG